MGGPPPMGQPQQNMGMQRQQSMMNGPPPGGGMQRQPSMAAPRQAQGGPPKPVMGNFTMNVN